MTFEQSTIDQIRSLIKSYEKANSADERKKPRQKMQKLGFKMTDFGITNITSADFERLITTKKIFIQNPYTKPPAVQSHTVEKIENEGTDQDPFELLRNEVLGAKYTIIDYDLISSLNYTGLYALRLKNDSILPQPFDDILDKRDHKIIYFGKAQGQNLADRLKQEIYAKGHGTFFRSIGAVLGYLPTAGSLIGKSNQNNYKFCKADEVKIIEWIEENLEIAIFPIKEKFEIEEYAINILQPLLNETHNPLSLQELKQLKNKCRQTARNN